MHATFMLLADEAPRWSYTLLDGTVGALSVFILGLIMRWIGNRESRLRKEGRAEANAEHDRESLDEFKSATRSQTTELKSAISELGDKIDDVQKDLGDHMNQDNDNFEQLRNLQSDQSKQIEGVAVIVRSLNGGHD